MSIDTATGDAASALIPLSAAARTAYQATYDTAQLAMQKTADPALLQSLEDSRLNAAAVLSRDNEYRIQANDLTYKALAAQINKTNDSLKMLQGQIAGIAKTIKEFADVADGISTVLTLVPKI